MNIGTESFEIAFRVSDKRFVIRDALNNDVFAGNYVEVESWLDQHENTVSALREEERLAASETSGAAEILKATMLTQEMIDKVLASDDEASASDTEPDAEHEPKFSSLRSLLFSSKQKPNQT